MFWAETCSGEETLKSLDSWQAKDKKTMSTPKRLKTKPTEKHFEQQNHSFEGLEFGFCMQKPKFSVGFCWLLLQSPCPNSDLWTRFIKTRSTRVFFSSNLQHKNIYYTLNACVLSSIDTQSRCTELIGNVTNPYYDTKTVTSFWTRAFCPVLIRKVAVRNS